MGSCGPAPGVAVGVGVAGVVAVGVPELEVVVVGVGVGAEVDVPAGVTPPVGTADPVPDTDEVDEAARPDEPAVHPAVNDVAAIAASSHRPMKSFRMAATVAVSLARSRGPLVIDGTVDGGKRPRAVRRSA